VSGLPIEFQLKTAETWASYVYLPRSKPDLSRKQLRFIDLFSSVGGLSLGVAEAIQEQGFNPRPVFAADVDAMAIDVYRANWPGVRTFQNSVRHLVDSHVIGQGESARFAYKPLIVNELLASMQGKIDLVVAGPPCQGNSSLNNFTRGNDPRNELYLQVPAIAAALDAPMVIIENVPGVVREQNNVVGTAAALLESNGYALESGVLSADKFGWPQTRKRFFLVASKVSAPIPFSQVRATFGSEAKSISWLLNNFPPKLDDSQLMSAPANLSEENLERAQYLLENEIFDLPLDLRPDCHKGGTTYTSSYGRMNPDRPAPTLTTGFFSPGRGRFIHPFEARTLTPREAARVQGFPDWFEFNPLGKTTRSNLAKWLGDAVPPLLGYLAAKSLDL